MPSWNDATMPSEILEEWERIIRKAASVNLPTAQEGKTATIELTFSHDAKMRVIKWKDEVNNKAYSATESDAVPTLSDSV